MTTVKLTSKAGLRTAATGALAGLAAAWFLAVVLTASAAVVMGAAVLVAAGAAAYLAGFRAGEATRRD